MSTENSQPREGPPSRQASTSSRQSARSQRGPSVAAPTTATPRVAPSSPRLPRGPRESSVSIFTGLTESSASSGPPIRPDGVSMSPTSIDRVFPVRSAVSIDPNTTPMPLNEPGDGFPGLNLGIGGGIAARREESRRQLRRESVSSPGRPATPPMNAIPPVHRSSLGRSAAKRRDRDAADVNDVRQSSIPTNANLVRVDHKGLSSLMDDSVSIVSENNSSVDGGGSHDGRPHSSSSRRSSPDDGFVTARFKHVMTEGGHAVITGRGGDTLQRCEDEPIHIPGAVQCFGLLVAFREEAGQLVVRAVSENSSLIIGYSPAQLFKLDSFLDILNEDQADNLLDHLDFVRDEQAADVVVNGPEVFMISIRPPHRRTRKLWCAMHVCVTDRELVICEFELEDDHINPLVPLGELTPEHPEDTLGSDPTPEELAESTVNISKPLRVLRSARKKRGEAAAMEVFNIMSQLQEQLASAPNLQTFLRVLIGVVKELSGFHRVMIYQFDQAWNGRVVAELVDPRATRDLYKGLHFPASDIPQQARHLYRINKVRLLYDRDQETARLVCRTLEDLEKPLDLTHSYLRAMSPIHIKYLRNMAVRASMSISINAFNELWGLIACHSYGPRGMRVSFPIRKMCRLVGDTASRNIERLSYASRLQSRKLINTASTAANPSGYIVASSDDLLRLFNADVGALSIRNETKIMGKAHGHLQEILAMVEYLRLRKLSSVCTSQDISVDFPDLRYAPGLRFLAGLLYVPLSNGGGDFIAFFRKGVLQEVKWAGNPYEKFLREGTEGYLEPRTSFKAWSETIVGRCRDWTDEEIETASVLCLVYGKFIDVWRKKEAAVHNSQLTRLLLANSAHEVRTPLNAIINYLEIALEGTLDHDTRENLAKSHSASKSLVYVINDLLDLTKTEGGNDLIKEEIFDLRATLRDATDVFVGDARRKDILYTVNCSTEIPNKVIGDHRRVRQVVTNLVANAFQHTSVGSVRVDAWVSGEQESQDRVEIEIAVEDTGAGMSQAKVDSLFRELEEVSYEHDDPASKLIDIDPFVEKGSDAPRTVLGLGLAVVARIIHTMNGQLRLKTEEGKGSRFVIQLSFEVEKSSDSPHQSHLQTAPQLITPSPGWVNPPSTTEGEITLVSGICLNRPRSASGRRRDSGESMNSLTSGRSHVSLQSAKSNISQKGDVDRLIDAIQEPLRLPGDVNSKARNIRDKRHLESGSAGSDKSPTRRRPRSAGPARDLKSSFAKIPGQVKVAGSGTSMKAIRLSDDFESARFESNVVFDEPQGIETPRELGEQEELSGENFSVLVAEDDPINSKIMKKRLEKMGHSVHLTVNGEECSNAHGEKPASYDAVLMDLQMPIVDGFSSTKMIRSFERSQSKDFLSRRARQNGRIPIFAVSASLLEGDRERYIGTGFDGWIPKPVDFKRVHLLLKGIIDQDGRAQCVYETGKWEEGGWFAGRPKQEGIRERDRWPSEETVKAALGEGPESAQEGVQEGAQAEEGTDPPRPTPSDDLQELNVESSVLNNVVQKAATI